MTVLLFIFVSILNSLKFLSTFNLFSGTNIQDANDSIVGTSFLNKIFLKIISLLITGILFGNSLWSKIDNLRELSSYLFTKFFWDNSDIKLIIKSWVNW